MSATTWRVIVLSDADMSTKTIEVSGEHGDDVIFNEDGGITIRKSWRSTGGGHRRTVRYPAWRVTQVEEESP